jgi:hypothetical protein
VWGSKFYPNDQRAKIEGWQNLQVKNHKENQRELEEICLK